eukprot:1160379-Pelagomonas_calceolata.AAC.15
MVLGWPAYQMDDGMDGGMCVYAFCVRAPKAEHFVPYTRRLCECSRKGCINSQTSYGMQVKAVMGGPDTYSRICDVLIDLIAKHEEPWVQLILRRRLLLLKPALQQDEGGQGTGCSKPSHAIVVQCVLLPQGRPVKKTLSSRFLTESSEGPGIGAASLPIPLPRRLLFYLRACQHKCIYQCCAVIASQLRAHSPTLCWKAASQYRTYTIMKHQPQFNHRALSQFNHSTITKHRLQLNHRTVANKPQHNH